MILEANITLLEQAADVLAAIDDEAYNRRAEVFGDQRIGGHVRHVIEFYERLLHGLKDGYVNYDARTRDPRIENDRTAAMGRLRELAEWLGVDPRLRADRALWVAGEGSGHAPSSVARELQAVCSHTVHHFALIAVLLRHQGLPVPPAFGVSKATLDFQTKQRAA